MGRRFGVLSLLLLALQLSGWGPCVLVPGGALEGASAPAPSDWTISDEISTVQLETRPAEPYSVNIWAVGLGPSLYIHAGANRSAWVEHIEDDARVRVRIDETLFDLAAVRVEAQEEFDRFSDAYEEKYGTRPRNENVSEAYLFRLGAR